MNPSKVTWRRFVLRYACSICHALMLCCLWSNSFVAQAQWTHKVVNTTSLAFSPDGKLLVAGSIEGWLEPGDLRVWDVQSGKLLHKERYTYGVESLAFSPDGKILAVATDVEQAKEGIRLWNMRSWHVDRAIGGQQYIYSIAFSPDGTRLVAGGNMGENGETDRAYLWNLRQRDALALPHSDGLAQMLFVPHNDYIIGAYFSGLYNDNSENLRAWDAQGHFLWRHSQPGLNSIAAISNSHTFIAGIRSPISPQKHPRTGALQLWDATKGRLLQAIPQASAVTAVAVSPDGRTWASGDEHGTVRLWNASKRSVTKTLKLHQAIIHILSFSPNGRFLASAGDDDYIHLTRLD